MNILHNKSKGDADEHKQQYPLHYDDHVVYAYGDVLYVYAPPGIIVASGRWVARIR